MQSVRRLYINPSISYPCCSFLSESHDNVCSILNSYKAVKAKVKQSRYTPWRRLGGEEI
jgi:hypothetical protein